MRKKSPEDEPLKTDVAVDREEIDKMIKEAEEEGKWFYSPLSNKWVTPSELKEHLDAGRFIYERGMWRLESPQTLIDAVGREIKRLKDLVKTVIKKINEEKNGYEKRTKDNSNKLN